MSAGGIVRLPRNVRVVTNQRYGHGVHFSTVHRFTFPKCKDNSRMRYSHHSNLCADTVATNLPNFIAAAKLFVCTDLHKFVHASSQFIFAFWHAFYYKLTSFGRF